MHPAHDRRWVHFHAALQHHLHKIAIADPVLAVPANTHQDDLNGKAPTLEHHPSYRLVPPRGLSARTNATEPIIGAPAWFDMDKFDIDAQPDGEGAPNDKQWKGMMQKLVTERCKLTFHRDKRELSVYVLSAAKTGPKLTKSEAIRTVCRGSSFARSVT